VNHWIPAAVRQRCRSAAEQFLARDLAWQNRYATPHHGEQGLRARRSTTGRERRLGRPPLRLEDVGPQLVHDRSGVESIPLGPNLWLDIPWLRSALDGYWAAATSAALTTSRLLH
jgi:hypothetical protein